MCGDDGDGVCGMMRWLCVCCCEIGVEACIVIGICANVVVG